MASKQQGAFTVATGLPKGFLGIIMEAEQQMVLRAQQDRLVESTPQATRKPKGFRKVGERVPKKFLKR